MGNDGNFGLETLKWGVVRLAMYRFCMPRVKDGWDPSDGIILYSRKHEGVALVLLRDILLTLATQWLLLTQQ